MLPCAVSPASAVSSSAMTADGTERTERTDGELLRAAIDGIDELYELDALDELVSSLSESTSRSAHASTSASMSDSISSELADDPCSLQAASALSSVQPVSSAHSTAACRCSALLPSLATASTCGCALGYAVLRPTLECVGSLPTSRTMLAPDNAEEKCLARSRCRMLQTRPYALDELRVDCAVFPPPML